jgi:divalent metal cation (Fe/Co/Zn/Cd) transporter
VKISEDIKNYYVPAITTAIAGAVALTIYFYMRKEAKETGSNLLKMASVHWITDAILEFGLFAGFLLGFVLTEMGRTKYTHYIDPIMTMILAGYLIKGPMAELIRSSGELLDASPEAEIKQKVKQMVDKYSPKALGEHRIRTRKAGGKIFVDVRFDVDPGMTAEYMAHLAHNFEREMSKHLPDCDVVVFFKSGSGNLAEGVA